MSSGRGRRRLRFPHSVLPDQNDILEPLRYVLVIVKGVFLKDMTVVMVFENAWPLLLIAAASLSVASWPFRRRLG